MEIHFSCADGTSAGSGAAWRQRANKRPSGGLFKTTGGTAWQADPCRPLSIMYAYLEPQCGAKAVAQGRPDVLWALWAERVLLSHTQGQPDTRPGLYFQMLNSTAT